MKIRIIIYFLLLLSLPVQLHAQTKRALVIGLGEQQDKAWKKINGDKDVPFVQAMLKNAGVAVERVEGIDIIRNYTEQSRIFSFRSLVLKSESSRHQPNHILQFIIVVEATLVYGIASDEVLF